MAQSLLSEQNKKESLKTIRLSTNSRYIKTPLFTENRVFNDDTQGTVSFFGIWNPPNIQVDASIDRHHVITESDIGRLDILSYNYYGTPSLWWVIAHVNNIINPINDIIPGEILIIPSPDNVYSAQQDQI